MGDEFFHRMHYNIRVNERTNEDGPILTAIIVDIFSPGDDEPIDPERNRWIRRKFVSPQIMEIEIDPSTVRYEFVSSRSVTYRVDEERWGYIHVTRVFWGIRMKFFSKGKIYYYYQWNLEYADRYMKWYLELCKVLYGVDSYVRFNHFSIRVKEE